MNEDKIIQKLIEHDEQLKDIRASISTKDDIRELKLLIEEVVVITKKIREDHIFALEWLKRLQDKVDEQDKALRQQHDEIRKIKTQLQMA